MGLAGTFHINYPAIKTFRFAENKWEATHPSTQGEEDVQLHLILQIQYTDSNLNERLLIAVNSTISNIKTLLHIITVPLK